MRGIIKAVLGLAIIFLATGIHQSHAGITTFTGATAFADFTAAITGSKNFPDAAMVVLDAPGIPATGTINFEGLDTGTPDPDITGEISGITFSDGFDGSPAASAASQQAPFPGLSDIIYSGGNVFEIDLTTLAGQEFTAFGGEFGDSSGPIGFSDDLGSGTITVFGSGGTTLATTPLTANEWDVSPRNFYGWTTDAGDTIERLEIRFEPADCCPSADNLFGVTQAVVPEPQTYVLFGTMVLGAGFLRFRSQKKKNQEMEVDITA